MNKLTWEDLPPEPWLIIKSELKVVDGVEIVLNTNGYGDIKVEIEGKQRWTINEQADGQFSITTGYEDSHEWTMGSLDEALSWCAQKHKDIQALKFLQSGRNAILPERKS